MSKNLWTREELLLAFNLYCKLPFGQYDQQTREIISLAALIGRSPSAVAMKLSNFASLDPFHAGRGVKGLTNISRADKAIWDEFHTDWNRVGLESEEILNKLSQTKQIGETDQALASPVAPSWSSQSEKPTEVECSIKARLGQQFFRTAVLINYRVRCCICDIPVRDLLIASHIIPWREREELRLNPHNGLCLCALHDRAFDKGLITIDSDYCVLVSQSISEHLPHNAVRNGFTIYAGQPISLPDKFLPDTSFLEFHRETYFSG